MNRRLDFKWTVLSLACVGCLLVAPNSQAQSVFFDGNTGGPWGGSHSNSPGDFIFEEGGVSVYVQEFQLGTFIGFDEAFIAPALPEFGFGDILCVSNINIQFEFFDGCPIMQFEFADFGGEENLRVNGDVLFEGELEDLDGVEVAPGVMAFVTTVPIQGGKKGMVFLDSFGGIIFDVWVGGQEFYLDNVEWLCPVPNLETSWGRVKALYKDAP